MSKSEIVEITKENAVKAYQSGNKETRETLENLFGTSLFKLYKNWQEIQSFESACEADGVDPIKFVKDLEQKGDTPDEIAYKKLKLIIKVINQKWTPDYNNGNQQKWWPYFNCKSGFGFSSAFTYYVGTVTTLGSRLVLETEKKAIHMGTYFLTEYKQFLM